jgi:hypothetical protein
MLGATHATTIDAHGDRDMAEDFQLLILGAMYENGGNATHRFLDGHPEMFVCPFESQLGTRSVNDALTSMFPVKYRWPVFLFDATPFQDYTSIIDEECKVRALTPHVSKFRHTPFDFSDDARNERYEELIGRSGRSTANNVAVFRATFDVWKNFRRSGRERVHVGYSPIITVDAELILASMPNAHVLHVVRNPFSAYADNKKRPVPMSVRDYMQAWCMNQYHALLSSRRHPSQVHIVRSEDVMAGPRRTLGPICEKLGLSDSASLASPSWNGNPLEEIYPWGTIRCATPEANRATAAELSPGDAEQIRLMAWQYLDVFEYGDFGPR